MDLDINIGASRERLRKLAREIMDACDTEGTVDLTIYAQGNSSVVDEVRMNFNNDDMENRDDLSADAVLVEVDED